MTGVLRVLTPGISCVTDLGRPRGSAVGQLTGGALDQYSAKVAQALVAGSERAPLLELTALDFTATTSVNLLVALTGAPADVSVDGVPMPQWQPFLWPTGTTLAVRSLRVGLRVYLAVHGRLEAPELLGSCAPDSVLGFSGALRAGDTIAVTAGGVPLVRASARPQRFSDHWRIPVTDGPDADQFGASAARLHRGRFVIGTQSNHIGLRLAADAGAEVPVRERSDEVLSRGVPIGAVEVPAGDELLVLHRGRGVTAGYPVLAVVTAVGLSRLGQARPGHTVSFERVSVAEAVAEARAEQAGIDALTRRMAGLLAAPDRGSPRRPSAKPHNHARPTPRRMTDAHQ